MFRTIPTLIGACALACVATSTQAELYISEYIEGSSNNKAIEIRNPDAAAVDLADYQLQMFFNGSVNAGLNIQLTGSIPPQGLFVIAHGSAAADVLSRANQTNGSGWFNGDDAVVLARSGERIDVIGQIGLDPGAAWASNGISTANQTLRRKASITGGDNNGDDPFDPALQWDGFAQDDFSDLGQFGGGNPDPDPDPDPNPVGQCGDPATLISAIQGSADASPLAGQVHTVEAVVTAGFQGSDRLSGFFLQEESAHQDNNPDTSEGLFVFDGNSTVAVQAGDLVRVTGQVTEYFGLTEITNVSAVTVCAQNQPFTTISLELPLTNVDALEKIEGMRVTLPQTLTVSENYNLGRFGELVLSNGRLQIPTHVAAPGAAAQALMASNARNRLLLDDGSSRQNPEWVPYPAPELTAANSLRAGDQVQQLEGVITYGFDAWRLQPVATPAFIASNQRPLQPDVQQDGNLKIASFNVLNFFNGDGLGGGFPTARGANNAEELERQAAKIVSAIRELDADIVGLMEIENDGYGEQSAIAELVQRLNAAGGDEYAFVNPGTAQLGGDAIAVGMLYKPAQVQPAGAAASITGAPFDNYNRQPLAQTFLHTASAHKVTVVVNHFKSKSCASDAIADNADLGDGQACWNAKRTEASNALAQWLATDPTASGSDKVLVIGDLNAYAQEDPISALKSAGYHNLLEELTGAATYTYVFNGEAGYLDHALASTGLRSAVVDAAPWHINADEPRVLDYNLEFKSPQQQIDWYAADAYRSSDHDPVLVLLNLQAATVDGDFNADGVRNGRDLLLLLQQMFRPVTDANRQFDLNADNRIGIADLIAFLRL